MLRLILPAILLSAVLLMSADILQEKPEVWEVPSEYKEMKNPLLGDKGSLSDGKMLYAKHCKSCHGKIGLADGPMAKSLKNLPILTKASVTGQTDGELYYKISFGRGEMVPFNKILPDDEDRWSIVNFIRTFGEGGK